MEFTTNECTQCGNPIPWPEMLDAHDNGGYCGWCWHHKNKDD